MLTKHGVRFVRDLTASGRDLLHAGKHSYDDFGLVPNGRLAVNPPEDLTPTVKIPGAREVPELRLTALSEDLPLFGIRSGDWEFSMRAGKSWPRVYSEILNYLHCREVRVVLDDDRAYYYQGVTKVSDPKNARAFGGVKIRYELRPYKYEICSSLEDWLWDPFNFYSGVIRKYGELEVTGNGARELVIRGTPLPVTPRVYADSDGMTVQYAGVSVALSRGVWIAPAALRIGEGDHTFRFAKSGAGTGKVSVDFRGGRL